WVPDGRGFYYVRHPLPGERPAEDLDFYQQVYFHQVGASETDDSYAVGKTFPRIAELQLASLPDPERYLVMVAHGDGGQFEYWISDGKSPWIRVTDPTDGSFGSKDRIGSSPKPSSWCPSEHGFSRSSRLLLTISTSRSSSAAWAASTG